ncbi:ribonucleoside-triphosphate reductase, adenosylcobalamin-dependent [Nocardia sp. NPDC059246]|uniref:ribonucleoside-triphosphate reductase, adenosylcobalamin-dependent n=1 Tax=unclassified Nocardia TaxID=2637762 RepID=UPI0036CEC29F
MEFTDTGRLVYERTYSRTKPDGTKEDWPETVRRVVDGNLALVPERYHEPDERDQLVSMMEELKILPAGRHLWASGVKGAQHLFNCWVSGWDENPWDHFEFTFLRLMEGGGVGANYSNRFLTGYDPVQLPLSVQIVCDPSHPDYQAMKAAGLLSERYSPEWVGSFVVEDSREGWASALVDLIQTHYRKDVQNFHRVYDVTHVRPAGSKLKTFGGTASGPAPLAKMLRQVGEIFSNISGTPLDGITAMEIDHALAECVVSGGVRRSARMAMMHWRDPQIYRFINIKADTGSHWTTNISVEVDSEFWEALTHPSDEQGSFADMVMHAISTGMVRNGEPGFWDSSLSNEDEPNPVICTNPCGEITLESSEPCNLGHVNLAAFVQEDSTVAWDKLLEAHWLMTRFLIRATFAHVNDPKSREVLDRNRRIGVGHLGAASYLAMRGVKYSQAGDTKEYEGYSFAMTLQSLKDVVDRAAGDYSHQLRIPKPVKTTTVAPTGTIAKLAGVSEGIHPIFSKYFIRRIRFSKLDEDQMQQVWNLVDQGYTFEEDQYADNTVVVSIPTKDTLVQAVEDIHGAEIAEDVVEGADDLTLGEMLAVQALYQAYWADNAVSFTANIDPDWITPEGVARALKYFSGRLKGATIFPESSMPQAPYERITREEYEAFTATSIADGVDEECRGSSCPIR